MTEASCPSCGGPVSFAIGSSIVVVCPHCRTLVARTDRGVEDAGRVAAIVDTPTPLRIDATGKYRTVSFRITGRTQMRHEAGGIWDEWYAAFDDGRWGWIAEAQGKFYLTFKTAEQHLPTFESLQIGAPVQSVDGFIVAETGTATLIAAEGELPWRPAPGERYRYADLSGREGRFATIDYSEEEPIVFKGVEATVDQLGIAGVARPKRVTVAKLSCSNCGGPLELRAPDHAERIICPNCGAMHDVDEGRLRFLKVLKTGKEGPRIPLGSRGKIADATYVIAGFMQRSVTFAGTKYYWTEYLLYNEAKGFRWLVDSDDHWSFVEPISVADVREPSARRAEWRGQSYKLFQRAKAHVEYVVGEFYWKVQVGETTDSSDFINPPDGLSKEVMTDGAREVIWSHARYMHPSEIESAFRVRVPRPYTVGPLQPGPSADVAKVWSAFVVALFVIALIVALTRADHLVFNDSISPGPAEATPGDAQRGATNTVFVNEFSLSGTQNVRIKAAANVNGTWAYVSGDLLNVDSGAVESFDIPVEFYEGYDQGEHWSEGSRSGVVYISAPPRGRYSMRLELQWEHRDGPPVAIEVREGTFRWTHVLLAFVVISLPAGFKIARKNAFEARRWADSEFSRYG